MQTGLLMSLTESQRQAINSSATEVAQHSAGMAKSKPQLRFLHQKQNIRI